MSSEITIQQQMDRFMQGAGDALTDDTVARLGFMMNELLIIADRVTRNKNIMKLLEMSESKDFAKMLDDPPEDDTGDTDSKNPEPDGS